MTEANVYLTLLILACVVLALCALAAVKGGNDADIATARADRAERNYQNARAELFQLRDRYNALLAEAQTPPRAYDVASLPVPADPWASAEAAEVAKARAEAALLNRALTPAALNLLQKWTES